MIELKRILEIWENSPRFPQIPDALQEIIELSFEKKNKRKPTSLVLTYIQKQKDDLLPILYSPVYQLRRKNYSARELIEKVDLVRLRNLLLVLWMQKLSAVGKYERIEYEKWHRQNLVAAFLARMLTQRYTTLKPDDVFIQAYFQDVSLLVLSRTLPEVYDALVLKKSKKRFDPSEEKKIIGTSHGQLSAWILKSWGFPEEFLPNISNHHSPKNEAENGAGLPLLQISQIGAGLLLGYQEELSYNQFEIMFHQKLKKTPQDLQNLIIEFVRQIAGVAVPFGFPDLSEMSVIRLLKENPQFLKKKLLSYEEVLAEALNAQKRIAEVQRELESLRNQQTNQQLKDPVTGLYAHIYLHEFLKHKVSEAARYEHPISLILLDIDKFQLFNTSYGFQTGNTILVHVSQLIGKNVRKSDLIARFGNDELAIVLPHAGQLQARFVGEKLRRLIAETDFDDPNTNKTHHITVSVGMATLMPTVSFMQAERLTNLARRALNDSKQKGGNCSTQVS